MGPSVIAASTTQFNVLVNSMFASTSGDGPIFWLAIAFRLMQLPLGAVRRGLGHRDAAAAVAAGGRRYTWPHFAASSRARCAWRCCSRMPSTVGLIMLAEPIISVLYQHGKFDAYQAGQAAGALRFYAIGLAGYAALKVLVNAFYALDRRKTPMLVSFLAVASICCSIGYLPFDLGWGHRGLAFSTGCIATVNFLLLYALMRGQLKGLESRRLLMMLAKVACRGAALIAVCAASSHWLLADWATQPFCRSSRRCSGRSSVVRWCSPGAALRCISKSSRNCERVQAAAAARLMRPGISRPPDAPPAARECVQRARDMREIGNAHQIAGFVETDEVAHPGKCGHVGDACTHRP